MLTRCRTVVGLLVVLFIAGCWEKDSTTSATTANVTRETAATKEEPDCCCDEVAETAPTFHARLRDIAGEYAGYGRVDGRLRWASALCIPIDASAYSPPSPPKPPTLYVSASKDGTTHGRKLYSLFAKLSEPGRYVIEDKVNPVGQVIVKESWIPEAIPDQGGPLQPVSRTIGIHAKDEKDTTKTSLVNDSFVPYIRKEGKLYHASKQGPLFIMYKLDVKTPNTDEGWVYGTVTADGGEVLAAGRVASCMNCHQKAPHDRLFGLPKQ